MIKQGVMELVKTAVFDTLFVPENLCSGRALMFVIPYGHYAGREIKQFDHTSMLVSGAMECPNKFIALKLRLGFYDHSGFISTEERIWQGVFSFETLGKIVLSGKLTDYASEGCWEEAKRLNHSVVEGRLGGESIPDDDPAANLSKELLWGKSGDDNPRIIAFLEQSQPFSMEVRLEHPGNFPVTFVASFEGIKARAIVT